MSFDREEKKSWLFEHKEFALESIKDFQILMSKMKFIRNCNHELTYIDKNTGEANCECYMLAKTAGTDSSMISGYPPKIDRKQLVKSSSGIGR